MSVGSRKSSRERALARLTVRDYSESEMREYLVRNAVSESEARQVVAKLVVEGLIRDDRLTREVVRVQAGRDKGPAFILKKLQAKGLSIDLRKARKLFTEFIPEGEESKVRQVLDRRFPKAHLSKKQLQRAYQGLVRRGFSQDIVRKCLQSLANLEDDLE